MRPYFFLSLFDFLYLFMRIIWWSKYFLVLNMMLFHIFKGLFFALFGRLYYFYRYLLILFDLILWDHYHFSFKQMRRFGIWFFITFKKTMLDKIWYFWKVSFAIGAEVFGWIRIWKIRIVFQSHIWIFEQCNYVKVDDPVKDVLNKLNRVLFVLYCS